MFGAERLLGEVEEILGGDSVAVRFFAGPVLRGPKSSPSWRAFDLAIARLAGKRYRLMSTDRPSTFVRSSENRLGVGKVLELGGRTGLVEYFLGPGCTPRTERVAEASLATVFLECETRVYHPLTDGVSWRVGRALASHGDGYLVKFPNLQAIQLVPTSELYTRCDLPLPDPSIFLAARITETPHWQQRRAGFVHTLVDQRRACAGLTGLLSAGIDLEPHQVEVVRRVLQDPVERYLLADEVGLGKTIEAGVIIRQYVLDHPSDHRVLVLVPPNLIAQWKSELNDRFRLGPLLGETVHVVPHDVDLDRHGPVGLLVIDEAHQIACWSAGTVRQRSQFASLCSLVAESNARLLLLSATPTLHSNEMGFQGLLHLLDPVVYPLGDLPGFRTRLAQHVRVAHLYHLFRPEEEGGYLEGSLDQLAGAFPEDVRLRELATALRPLLAYGANPDDPAREELVRAVRSHVSEAYRLHRRLLRNRRADERVEGLLPGRVGLLRWEYTDPVVTHMAGLLDEWRTAVSAAEGATAADYGQMLAIFAEALACDPATLTALVDLRLGGVSDDLPPLTAHIRNLLTQTPEFDGEPTILARFRDAASAANPSRRLDALVAGLVVEFTRPKSRVTRAVVFASYPSVADWLFEQLHARWPGEVLRHGQPGWQHFRTTPSFRALVCDSTAEEGLNLNGRGTLLVHYDLPWSPNRVEQRIGRLDRFGIGTPVVSALPIVTDDPFATAWADYLNKGYRVFERSVAALQYLTEAELTALYPAALADGPTAITAATDRLGGADGVVESALRDIQVLDQLDAVEAPPGHEDFAETLRQTDQMRKTDWQEAMHTWVAETLQFARRHEFGPQSGVWRYQFRRPIGEGGPSTLMPVGRLIYHFQHIIDTDDDRSTPQAPLTYSLTFDRVRAQKERVALARIGDPFVDALADYVHWDDRGAVAAMWRHRPSANYGKPAEVAFQFEFVVECPIDEAIAEMPEASRWSTNAVRRSADWLFPPFAISVWLDENLEPITLGSSKWAILVEEYSKRLLPDGGRDFNLNPDRWTVLDNYFPRGDWARQVERARVTAEQAVRKSQDWALRIEERLDAAKRTNADRAAQAASRLAFLTGAQRDVEAKRAAIDAAMAAALLRGIESPSISLDSTGAVFLANWNPFTDTEG